MPPPPPPADGTETASLFASLGTEVLPEEEEAGGAAPTAGGQQQSASDRDDYSSAGEQQLQGGIGSNGADGVRSGGTPNGRLRRQGSRGSAASDGDLPASAGLRSEAAQQGGGGGEGGAGGDKGDAKILRELFEGSGVRGAIDHAKVEGANDPNLRAEEHEAARIARRAAAALRQSRLQCQQAPVNQPTWTGRSGGAGLPASDGQPRFGRATNPRLQPAGAAPPQGPPAAGGRRFGAGGSAGAGLPGGTAAGAAPRSSEILARLRERQAAVASAAAAAAAADPALDQAQQLAAQVASFLENRGGSAASDELVQHFQASVGPAHLALFRGVLKQVAQLQRRGAGKVWVLRPEYASAGVADG